MMAVGHSMDPSRLAPRQAAPSARPAAASTTRGVLMRH